MAVAQASRITGAKRWRIAAARSDRRWRPEGQAAILPRVDGGRVEGTKRAGQQGQKPSQGVWWSGAADLTRGGAIQYCANKPMIHSLSIKWEAGMQQSLCASHKGSLECPSGCPPLTSLSLSLSCSTGNAFSSICRFSPTSIPGQWQRRWQMSMRANRVRLVGTWPW